MKNTMFCTIAVRAPKGWSNQRMVEHILTEMRGSRGQHMPDDERRDLEYAASQIEPTGLGQFQRQVKGDFK